MADGVHVIPSEDIIACRKFTDVGWETAQNIPSSADQHTDFQRIK
jgi:hypothetical protein